MNDGNEIDLMMMMMTGDDDYPKVNEEFFVSLLLLMMKILRVNQEEYMTVMNDHVLYAVMMMIFDNDE